VLLFAITITQFGIWGYQSVLRILGAIFAVKTPSTFLDIVIGFIAMIASGILFAGSAMWWKRNFHAFSFMTYGAAIFMVKNVLDLINNALMFGKTHTDVTLFQIQGLGAQLGSEFFQLAFLVFIFFYFRTKIVKEYTRLNVSREQVPPTDQVSA